MAFDRLVAKQEPRAWLLTTFEFLKKLFTPAGQQQLSQFLVDFFTFKIMLVEVLIPLLYFLSLIVAVSKGIEQASLFCLRQGNVGIVAGIAYFVTSAVGYRIFYEQAMTTFSIHSVLRTIKKGII